MTQLAVVPSPRVLPPWAGDVGALAVALLIGGLATDAAEPTSGISEPLATAVGLAAVTVLWWRRRWPVPVGVVAFAASVVSPLAAGAAIVAIYTVGAHRPGRIPWLLGAGYGLALVVGTALHPDTDSTMLQSVAVGLLLAATALGWGLVVRARTEGVAAIAERARRAEAEQEARVASARQAERERIAADMHDALAHRLSMLSLHAGALELHPDATGDDLARSAAIIRSHAHLALEDLRAAIGVMRVDGAPRVESPTVADLPALFEDCRAAGMDLRVTGLSDAFHERVPAALSPHVFRIVQEGLTNARRHGAGGPTELALQATLDDAVAIMITNAIPPDDQALPSAGGNGLIGLDERVRALGGTLSHGEAGGVHRLEVRLPWRQ